MLCHLRVKFIVCAMQLQFCLIFRCVVLLFLYVVVGVLVMKFVKKAQGPEMILNLSFWKEFPGRVKVRT